VNRVSRVISRTVAMVLATPDESSLLASGRTNANPVAQQHGYKVDLSNLIHNRLRAASRKTRPSFGAATKSMTRSF
jgi:hypothetical protein